MTRATAVHCAKHGLVHVEECPSCLMSRLRAELAEQRREWAEARLEADDLRAERDALAGALLTRSGELEETRAEVERLQTYNCRDKCGCEDSGGTLGCGLGCPCRCHALRACWDEALAERDEARESVRQFEADLPKYGRHIMELTEDLAEAREALSGVIGYAESRVQDMEERSEDSEDPFLRRARARLAAAEAVLEKAGAQ